LVAAVFRAFNTPLWACRAAWLSQGVNPETRTDS
jgi:hypothetical protein